MSCIRHPRTQQEIAANLNLTVETRTEKVRVHFRNRTKKVLPTSYDDVWNPNYKSWKAYRPFQYRVK